MACQREERNVLKESLRRFSRIDDRRSIPEQFNETISNLETICISQKEKTSRYEVAVHTSDIKFAGTNANVFVVLVGDQGTSQVYSLGNNMAYFERNMLDIFKLDAENVGSLQALVIGIDNKGPFSDWHLDTITVTKYLNKTEQELRLSTLRSDPHCPVDLFNKDGLAAKLPFTDIFHFRCNDWLTKKVSVRELDCDHKETTYVQTLLPGAAKDEYMEIKPEVKGGAPMTTSDDVRSPQTNEKPRAWILPAVPQPRIQNA